MFLERCATLHCLYSSDWVNGNPVARSPVRRALSTPPPTTWSATINFSPQRHPASLPEYLQREFSCRYRTGQSYIMADPISLVVAFSGLLQTADTIQQHLRDSRDLRRDSHISTVRTEVLEDIGILIAVMLECKKNIGSYTSVPATIDLSMEACVNRSHTLLRALDSWISHKGKPRGLIGSLVRSTHESDQFDQILSQLRSFRASVLLLRDLTAR